MYSARLTRIYFVLEAANSLATTYFFYYLYFLTKHRFGLSDKQNLALAACLGLCYAAFSVLGGRFSQRRGYFNALKLGLGAMSISLTAGAFVESLWPLLGLILIANFGMALTWPALEALVSERQTAERLQRNIGIYNIVWAVFQALAYFSGGAMIKAWGFRAMFFVPVLIQLGQIALTVWVERQAAGGAGVPAPVNAAPADEIEEREKRRSPISPQTFLKMAWVANPFAYLAINTVVAIIPSLATRLELSVMWAGIFCSVWQFVRSGAFVLLWMWDGWHYRFRWLIGAYIAMGVGFVVMLVVPNLAVLLAAQVVFGLSTGLLYYSSLYYSMHVGETKGEHGGLHEAMIGAGCFAGPAVGALTLHFLPQYPSSGALAVAGLLTGGFGVLSRLRWARK